MEPVVSLGTTDIVIRTDTVPNPEVPFSYQSNDWIPVTVALSEPIGYRTLIDATCLDGDKFSHLECRNGGIRWVP